MSPGASRLATLLRCVALRRSQRWPAERLQALQAARLARVLETARGIPFYAERWPKRSEDAVLADLPILPRAEVAELNRSVRGLHPPGHVFLAARSSGSTGRPAEFLFDRGHQAGRFAARARYLLENGLGPLRRSAWVIYLPEGVPDARLVRGGWLPGARFLSTFTPVSGQVRWLKENRPEFLYTLPSNLGELSRAFEASGERLPTLRRIFTGGEVLDASVRERARAVFGVDVSDNYGSTEACLAWQCPAGGYHVNAEHLILEILTDAGAPAAPGERGRVVVTTLENHLMPLVRYEIGDLAVAASGPCGCGRTLPRIETVVGRSIDLFPLPDGRRVSPWEVVVRIRDRPETHPLEQLQIVQDAPDRFRLRYVAGAALESSAEETLGREFRAVLGADAHVVFERVGEIERNATGKFPTAVSLVR